MRLFKRKPTTGIDSADDSRRSFFCKLGAGASAALASTAGIAGEHTGKTEGLALQVALLEDEQALRKLQQSFEQALDDGRYEDAVALFAADAAVVFNGGIFAGRDRGVSRLFSERFRAGKSGKSIEPAPGFEVDADQQQDSVTVAADRRSANAEFPYSIQLGAPVESESSLAGMARLQGDGIQAWWEGGIYKVTFTREGADDRWLISRLEYETLSRADYRSGRTEARPISVAPLATPYPADPQGPDVLA